MDDAPGYDMSIHQNPDARAWAAFYTKVRNASLDPDNFDTEENMLGWFANAMMAMHDHLQGGGPINGDHAQYLLGAERGSDAALDREAELRIMRQRNEVLDRMEAETRLILAEYFRRGVSQEKWQDAAGVAARNVRASLEVEDAQ